MSEENSIIKIIFFLTSMLLGFMLLAMNGTTFTEQTLHHGYLVEVSGEINDCLVCHDGSVASYAYYCIKECNIKTSHSVLKDYPPWKDAASYAPVARLKEKKIRLHNGKTTCLSCHDLKNPDRNHLVIDNAGSNLCFTCHLE
jgi:predicted CXXCH cytochrome family protein